MNILDVETIEFVNVSVYVRIYIKLLLPSSDLHSIGTCVEGR
jgi:hypothetical protein